MILNPIIFRWIIALVTALPLVSSAATLTVDTTVDNAFLNDCTAAAADCSLRGAIRNTNSSPGIDIIELPAGNYGLSSAGSGEDAALTGDLDITDALIINGSGMDTTLIDAGGDSGLLDRVFDVQSDAQLNLSSVTFGGGVAGPGGGMRNLGITELSHVRVIANLGRSGSGIHNSDTLTVLDSIITENNSKEDDDGEGGGISNFGSLTMKRSIVSSNGSEVRVFAGGGIYNLGPATIEDSVISGNHGYQGGGVLNLVATQVNIIRTSIRLNMAGIQGGGLDISSGEVTVKETTISDNTVEALGLGGGVSVNGGARILNSTISGNVVGGGTSGSGGGIRVDTGGDIYIESTTVANNRALGGDALHNNGITYSRNSILQSPDQGDDPCGGTSLGSDGGMVISAPSFLTTNNATCGLSEVNNELKVTPEQLKLGPLADNGGPTLTHAISEGSVAIEATVIAIGCLSWDQRGWWRGDLPCDSGAFEFNARDPEIILIHGFEDSDAPQP